jgi:aryl-alcohol dehydrogenase-like predicted oxidoreductase
MEPEDVEWSLNNSLEMLGVDYVDAFLVHWPVAAEKTTDNQVKLGKDGKVSFEPSYPLSMELNIITNSISSRIP